MFRVVQDARDRVVRPRPHRECNDDDGPGEAADRQDDSKMRKAWKPQPCEGMCAVDFDESGCPQDGRRIQESWLSIPCSSRVARQRSPALCAENGMWTAEFTRRFVRDALKSLSTSSSQRRLRLYAKVFASTHRGGQREERYVPIHPSLPSSRRRSRCRTSPGQAERRHPGLPWAGSGRTLRGP